MNLAGNGIWGTAGEPLAGDAWADRDDAGVRRPVLGERAGRRWNARVSGSANGGGRRVPGGMSC